MREFLWNECFWYDFKKIWNLKNFYSVFLKGFADYDGFNGEENVNLKNGYIRLVKYLSSNISKNAIKLNEFVLNIDWSSASVINVKTSVGTYKTKKIVNTVSLGVLKANHKTMYTPALPSEKISVINKLGFGTVNKIFFVFEKPVFDGNQAGIQFLWTNDTNFKLKSDKTCNLNGNEFYKSFNSLVVLPKNKNILFGFFVGKDSIFSERLSDSCLIDVFAEMLDKFFPKLKIPRPIDVVRSKWNSNPLVQGSYSFPKVGSQLSDTKLLAKPVVFIFLGLFYLFEL